jgi:glutamate dehydrogenase/leucine dehydrogenase
MAQIHRQTQQVFCRPEADGGSGDSSGPTALGVQSSIRAVVEHRWPGRNLSTLRFAVIGLGHVGSQVGAWLAAAGARLVVSDVDPALKKLAQQWKADWVTPEQALTAEVDVLVPCATGGLLTAASTASLKCAAVVGAANNQLDHPATAELLHERGVLWAPDSVVSAGGIIAAVARELHGATATEAERQVRGIGGRLATILEDARARGISPLTAARALVALRLRTGR